MSDSLKQIRLSLFLLRLGVTIVMGIWVVNKFVNPEHTARVFGNFYFISGLSATASDGAIQ